MKRHLTNILLCLISIGTAYSQGTIKLQDKNTPTGTLVACQNISLLPGFSFSSAEGKSLTLKVDASTCDPYAGKEASLSETQNYIRTRSYTNEAGTAYLDQIQYFDGLGRPMQTVQRGITPLTADLVTYQEYDSFGRDDKSWLPAVVSGNNGAYIPFTNYKPKAIATYSDSAYSCPIYEASPLNRVLEQYGPGNAWYTGKRAVRTEYLTNISNNDTLNCILYTVNDSNPLDSTVTITRSKNYDTGQLYVTRLADEDGNTTFEFKDKLGQVVLTRQIIRNGSSKNLHDTYYIYDDFGNQKAVLPPIASDAMKTGTSWSNKGTVSLLRDYAYLYEYDSRNRCVAKRIPGTHWIYYVYDKADRLIFTQDGEQRKKKTGTKSEWLFNKYDVFGRLIISGIYKTTESHEQLAARFGNVVFTEKTGNGGYGYTWDTLKQTDLEDANSDVLLVNYYDDISHFFSLTLHTNYKQILAYSPVSGYGVQHTNAKGQLVATRVKNIDSAGKSVNTRTGEIVTAMYHDDRGRLIQVKSTNHIGGVEEEYLAYNFTGQPIKKQHIHSATGKSNIKEEYAYTYDHAGRLLKTTHQLTEGTTVKPQVTLAENTYDELGRLQTHKANNQANLNTNYTYNIRSWTKSISSPLFSQTLYYNDKVAIHNYSDYQPSYNGNISGMEWNVQAEAKRSYRFKYDNLSRLTHAAYNGVTDGGMYNTSYQYDKHGNIQDLVRRGKNASAADNNVVIDKLTMTYSGNQLVNVADAVANFAYGPSADFKDKVSPAGTIEYTYNANGAMTKDLNKGISNIAYNSLNLPRQMVINSATAKAKNYYTYSASGVKLKTEQRYDPNLSVMPVETTNPTNDGLADYKNTDYVGNIIYETVKSGSTITNKTRILVDGGYIEGGVYYFYLSDHLGNNRVVANAGGTPIQKNHYYPFGTAFAEGTPQEQGKQPYKYNGKQLDDMHQLNLYDYSARYYESAVGRFTSVDPLAEKYYSISPYAYVGNNPINAIDPTGELIIFINGFHLGDGGSRDYWDKNGGGFASAVEKQLNDQNSIFIDGSLGGVKGVLGRSLGACGRGEEGYYYGKKQAEKIISSLKNGETIKFITHSMGAAYSKGYIKALVEYMLENNIDPTEIIEFEANFAPFQPTKQKAAAFVKTFQYSHKKDYVAGSEAISGAEYKDTSSDKNQDHKINTFYDQIKTLPAGKYNVVDGVIVPQK